MKAKFKSPSAYNSDDPNFKHLVCLSGALVPVAHIKLIGNVQTGLDSWKDVKGLDIPLFSFPVMLTDADFTVKGKERVNPQILFESWPTLDEAEDQRRNLAIQVDNYYKKLLGEK